jgi:hypothetical protein
MEQRMRYVLTGVVAIGILVAACVLLWRFGAALSWTDETGVGGLPCVLRAARDYESYLSITHPGWCGLTLRYVRAENPPDVSFTVSTVPEGNHVVSGAFVAGKTEATARFQPLWVPPQTPMRIAISVEDGREDLLLHCREVHGAGRTTERVVLQTHHRYAPTILENLSKWLATRVAPFTLPGLSTTLLAVLLVVPVGSGIVLVLCFGGRYDDTAG